MANLPTVTVVKDGQKVIINQSDRAEWQAKGWDVPKIAEPETDPKKSSGKKK